MLGFFPEPYPDELLYSVFARYYVRSGYSNYIFTAEDLFQKRSLRPNFEYLPALSVEVVDHLTKNRSFTDVLVNHTMFPYHCRFFPQERKERALNSLIAMDNNYHDLILFPKRRITPTMRYCPMCAVEDRKHLGETYWHRIHQIFELPVCHIHYCYIVNTDYQLSGKSTPNLIPADSVIPQMLDVNACENKRINSLAQYIETIFEMPIKIGTDLSVACVFKKKTENTEYRSARGEVCRITHLYMNFANYYDGLVDDIPEQWKIHKLLTGKRYDFWEISLLGFFLNVEPQEYLEEEIVEKSQNEVFDNKILELHREGLSYPQIANRMGLSIHTIKNAAYLKTKKSKPRKRKGGKPGRRPLDWDSMDREILPKVIETISGLKNSDKPQRITIGGVARLIGLKSKQIDKLPICKSEIIKNAQPQEVYWAEKVVWAWKTLSSEGRPISVKQIRLRTNMSTDQIRRCMSDLEKINIEVFTGISRIIKNNMK